MSSYNAGIFLFENDAPLNPGNPYRAVGLGGYAKQSPFGTFGVPFFLGLIGKPRHALSKPPGMPSGSSIAP
jgi:hypothetical protein